MTVLRTAAGFPITFSPGDEATAAQMAEAVEASLVLAKDLWGLPPPERCHLYVMTSWRGFLFGAAPWPWKVLIGIGYPLWSGRAHRTWAYSAGWTVRYGRRTAIGVKPPRLLDRSDRSVGEHIFVEETDPVAKVRHVTCHEIIHAASAHLRLPPWLNEGLAAVSVDRFIGKETIRRESLRLLERHEPKGPPLSYRAMARLQGEALAYHAVRGYWIVRYLEATWPGLVRSLLAKRSAPGEIERVIAGQLGLPAADLWRQMDGTIAAHFRTRPEEDSSP